MINELNSLNIVNVNTPDEIAAHTTLSAASKASILIEALPYIQKFAGKTMVIKYGGNAMIENGTIQGGMIPKVEAVLHALECGTHRVSIIDGREPHALLLELFTNKGIGTEII